MQPAPVGALYQHDSHVLLAGSVILVQNDHHFEEAKILEERSVKQNDNGKRIYAHAQLIKKEQAKELGAVLGHNQPSPR